MNLWALYRRFVNAPIGGIQPLFPLSYVHLEDADGKAYLPGLDLAR